MDSIGPLTAAILIAVCSVAALYRVYILPGYERDRDNS